MRTHREEKFTWRPHTLQRRRWALSDLVAIVLIVLAVLVVPNFLTAINAPKRQSLAMVAPHQGLIDRVKTAPTAPAPSTVRILNAVPAEKLSLEPSLRTTATVVPDLDQRKTSARDYQSLRSQALGLD